MRLLESNELSAGGLARAAEIAGREIEDDSPIEPLLHLLNNKSLCVREAAIYALSRHANERVLKELGRVADEDPSRLIREIATEEIQWILE